MKKKIVNAYRWFVNRLPEALLALFLLFLLPFVYLAGRAAVGQVSVMRAGEEGLFGAVWADPWPVAAVFVCLAGSAAVVYLLWRSRALIWAVARKMIVEALHRRAVLVLLVFFLVLMPAMPFILETEGTLKSQVQITFTYALTLAEVLLCLLAIFVATASICREIEQRQVHITDTKPLPRWQFLAGKLLGIVVMCSALLFVMATAAFGLVVYMTRAPDYSKMTEYEVQEAKHQRRRLTNEVLVSRTSVRPPLPDVEQQVEQELERLQNQGELQEMGGKAEARETLRRHYMQRANAVPPMALKLWKVSGLRPPSEAERQSEYIYVRFKLMAPGASEDETVSGSWTAYVISQSEEAEEGQERAGFVPVFRVPGDRVSVNYKPGSFQEVRMPAGLISPGGSLYLSYKNWEPNRTVIFPVGQGLEVLQRAGGFLGNYYRSLVVIMFHIVLLAALGLMAGSVFSFPVASLLVVFIFMLGVAGPWFMALTRSVALAFRIEGKPQLTYFLNAVLNNILVFVFKVVPHFAKNSPVGDLVSGRLVSWSFVAQVGAMMVFIKGGIATLIGVFCYSRRELARVIV